MATHDTGQKSSAGQCGPKTGVVSSWHQRPAVLQALARGNAIIYDHQQKLETLTDEELQQEDWVRGARIKMDIIKHRAIRPWRRGFACMGILCALGAKVSAFDVVANNMPVSDFVGIVSEQFKKSVVFAGSEATEANGLQQRSVTGAFYNLTLSQAIETIEQVTGFRSMELGGVVYLTSPHATHATVYPVGLSSPQIEGVTVSNGYAQVRGDKVVTYNSAEVIGYYRNRRTALMEVLVTDTTQETSDALQELLNAATVTLSIQGELFNPTDRSSIDVRSVMAFIDQDKTSNVVMNTSVRIMSGEEIQTAVGRVLEREIYVRPDQTSTDLITRYDTLQLGFELKVNPYWDGERWQFKYQISDTDYTTEQKRATFAGVDVIAEGRGSHILKLNRNVDNVTKRGIPILGKIPYVKKAFTWETKTGQKRAINIIVNIYENQKK